MLTFDLGSEWLETDGLGGFASGTIGLARTRRYHALLLAATTPPTGRVVLVNGTEAWLETPAGRFALSAQRYQPDIVHPDGARRIVAFVPEPWPTWTFEAEDGTRLVHEIIQARGRARTLLRWRLAAPRPLARLFVRLLMSGRDYHALHRENGGFAFAPEAAGEALVWRPYPGLPAVHVAANADYRHDPVWYWNFLYAEEQARGLDCVEDLASPGSFAFDLARGAAVLTLTASMPVEEPPETVPAIETGRRIVKAERRRRGAFASPLERAAEAYFVARGGGRTVIAGYPWFTDWGRDTFIALRGLALRAGRFKIAGAVLLAWADAVSDGMLPNRFPDRGDTPEYNSVDASLWYVICVHEYLAQVRCSGHGLTGRKLMRLEGAVEAILRGYRDGTRFGIRADDDGLIAAGVPGVQLTWMDAKVGGLAVTPRIGKPVEIQALWLNALKLSTSMSGDWQAPFRRGLDSFRSRFWNEAGGFLYDVVDVDHQPGRVDASFRPNQIFAVGGLPIRLLDGAPARSVVDAVEERLWTPLGLRSLAPGEDGYRPRYQGGVVERDGSYHQGTVWPWLAGPFVDAWLRVRGFTPAARAEARRRFLEPLLDHLGTAGLGHVSEIADAVHPHTPRGCPFQAWSLGELLRIAGLVGPDAAAAAEADAGRGNRRHSGAL